MKRPVVLRFKDALVAALTGGVLAVVVQICVSTDFGWHFFFVTVGAFAVIGFFAGHRSLPWPRERSSATSSSVVLRNTNDAHGSRVLDASLSSKGDVIIQGRDYGDGVERIFGFRESEWAWTIAAADVPALLGALEAESDVLSAIRRRFSGDSAAGLASLLESNGISAERWSRIGD